MTMLSKLIDDDPDVIRVRNGGGCLSIFGLPFLLAGILMVQAPFGLVPIKFEGDMNPAFVVLFGTPFFLVGAALVFGRSGVTIDRRAGVIRRWWRLIVPIKSVDMPIYQAEKVTFSFDPGDSESPSSYSVQIVLKDAGKPVPVFRCPAFGDAQRLADRLSAMLDKPLEDTVSGESLFKEPGLLKESLRERIKRTGGFQESLPDAPFAMRSHIESSGGETRIRIPLPDYGGLKYLPVLIPVVFGVFIWFQFMMPFYNSPGHGIFRYAIAAFMGLFFVVFPAVQIFRKSWGRQSKFTVVTSSQRGLKVEEHAGGRVTTTEMPAEDIRDMTLQTVQSSLARLEKAAFEKARKQPGTVRMKNFTSDSRLYKVLHFLGGRFGSQGITVRTGASMITFGKGLSDQEAVYIHALIKKALAE
jgi:hypothetical protein